MTLRGFHKFMRQFWQKYCTDLFAVLHPCARIPGLILPTQKLLDQKNLEMT